ncbi:hypothetical protein ACFWNT_19350 [Streptomyces sp. NPDC058409]|jgi:nucleoside-diphosphate-sugar epimerase|uniref:hypothetical protein n=1 Tax=Streptomyces sp. NPDC058409 TaxID=3346484 RepID=UPI003660EDAC
MKAVVTGWPIAMRHRHLQAADARRHAIEHGGGLTTRDYAHVSGQVATFPVATERGSELFNVDTGLETSVLDIPRPLAEMLGIDREPEISTPLGRRDPPRLI